jgi:AhpD family alkylhydroperoxidase
MEDRMEQGNVAAFTQRRAQLNELLGQYAGRDTKRFLSLDHQAYLDGALPAKTKELLGLVASLVLRCDDCVMYHITQCHACGVSTEELIEALHIGLIAGGSITIPHLRRAIAAWDELAASAPSATL